MSIWGGRFYASHIAGGVVFVYGTPLLVATCPVTALIPGPEMGAPSPGMDVTATPEILRGAAWGSWPILPDKVGESSFACVEGNLSGAKENGVFNTVGEADGVCSLRLPQRAPSGTRVSKFRAKGVAAGEPCRGNMSPIGSPATAKRRRPRKHFLPCGVRNDRRDGEKSKRSWPVALGGGFRPVLRADVERSTNTDLLRPGLSVPAPQADLHIRGATPARG